MRGSVHQGCHGQVSRFRSVEPDGSPCVAMSPRSPTGEWGTARISDRLEQGASSVSLRSAASSRTAQALYSGNPGDGVEGANREFVRSRLREVERQEHRAGDDSRAQSRPRPDSPAARDQPHAVTVRDAEPGGVQGGEPRPPRPDRARSSRPRAGSSTPHGSSSTRPVVSVSGYSASGSSAGPDGVTAVKQARPRLNVRTWRIGVPASLGMRHGHCSPASPSRA